MPPFLDPIQGRNVTDNKEAPLLPSNSIKLDKFIVMFRQDKFAKVILCVFVVQQRPEP